MGRPESPLQTKPNICCLATMQNAYLTLDHLQFPSSACGGGKPETSKEDVLWVLNEAYKQEHDFALNTSGVWFAVNYSMPNRIGNVSLEIQLSTVLQNKHSLCTNLSSSGEVECTMLAGIAYVNVISISPVPRLTFKITQRFLKLSYLTGSAVTITSLQSLSCVETIFTVMYTNKSSGAWFLTVDILLQESNLGLNQTVFMDSLSVAYGDKGNSLLYEYANMSLVSSLSMQHNRSLSVQIFPNTSIAYIKTLTHPVIYVNAALDTNICIDTFHISVGIDKAIELDEDTRMINGSNPGLQLWVLYGITQAAFSPVIDISMASALMNAKYGTEFNREGIMAIATNLPSNTSEDVLQGISIFTIRGSTRQEQISDEINSNLNNHTEAQHICQKKYSRECFVTQYAKKGVSLVYSGLYFANAEVCARHTQSWTDTKETIEIMSGLGSAAGIIKILKYMQHICTFITKKSFKVMFIHTPRKKWPTFPVGVNNKQNIPDKIISKFTMEHVKV